MPVFRVPGIAAAFNPFDFYLGPSSTDPLFDNDGDPLVEGQSYWNTVSKTVRYYNGTAWVDSNFVGGIVSGLINARNGIRIATTGTALRANFNNATGTPIFQVEGVDFNSASMASIRASVDASAPFLVFGKSRSAVGGNGLVNNSDGLGTISFQGNDGTEFVEAAAIRAFVDAAPGANDMPGMLIFAVTPDGGTSAVEAMRISQTGNVNIGGTPSSAQSLRIGKNLTSSTGVNGVRADGQIQSDVTASAIIYASVPSTAAAAFTLSQLAHFRAVQGTIGAGSAISEQNGFFADSSLIGAATNIGFRGNIPTGTNRWNLYMDGTAPNYLAGELRVGDTVSGSSAIYAFNAGVSMRADSTTAATPTFQIVNASTAGDATFVAFYTESRTVALFRGSITYNRGSGVTAYNTTSDYRSKTVLGTVEDSLGIVKALKPIRGLMHGATVERPMFVAHELADVAPYAVTGEKDAVNEDGSPMFQQVDASTLVPVLVAAIQELASKNDALVARIAALENNNN